MNEFKAILNDIESNSQIQAAVLISGKPGCFIAGADISMLEQYKTVEDGTRVSKTGQDILGIDIQLQFIGGIQFLKQNMLLFLIMCNF